MGIAVTQLRMSAQDFLAWDETQSVRHEFVAGEVFAMAGLWSVWQPTDAITTGRMVVGTAIAPRVARRLRSSAR